MVDIEPKADRSSGTGLLELGLPEAAPSGTTIAGPTSRFVTFFFGENLYGVRAEDVEEVTHPLPITPVPNAPEPLLGISPLRGEVVAIIDVRNLLAEKADLSAGRQKFVILKSFHSETRPGFAVDRMHEFVSLTSGEIQPNRGDSHPFITGTALSGDTVFGVIDRATIAAALRT